MNHRQGHEEPNNSDRWLLTYADLITLLLGLFVILYTLSNVDGTKYGLLIDALGGVFGGGSPTIARGGPEPTEDKKTVWSERVRLHRVLVNSLPVNGGITFSTTDRGVTVQILNELLFASGSASLRKGAMEILDTLATLLGNVRHSLRVEGHTDDVPMQTKGVPSNWHLSATRAANTAEYLIRRGGIDPARVAVIGYAEHRPLVPNTSAKARMKNRRVDIVIETQPLEIGRASGGLDH